MDRKTLIWCTAAIVITIIGCAWWIHTAIEDNTYSTGYELEQLRR